MKRMTGACAANRPWTEEDRAELARLRRAGLSSQEIAERIGRTIRAVDSAACKMGLPSVRKPHRTTELEQVRRLAERGYSDRVIGITIGRTRPAVYQLRKKYNIRAGALSKNKRWGYTPADIRVIARCYETSSKPIVEAARLLGRSVYGVQHFASKHGLTKRGRRK